MKMADQYSESRFQRFVIDGSLAWGDAPGYGESRRWRFNLSDEPGSWQKRALLKLTTNSGGDCSSAEGAAFKSSLGQRPRVSGLRKSPALKARFILATGACPTGTPLHQS